MLVLIFDYFNHINLPQKILTQHNINFLYIHQLQYDITKLIFIFLYPLHEIQDQIYRKMAIYKPDLFSVLKNLFIKYEVSQSIRIKKILIYIKFLVRSLSYQTLNQNYLSSIYY